MSPATDERRGHARSGAHINAPRAWRVLLAFLLTFIAARLTVLLIVTRRLPDIYLRVRGTHVHHLNYGIFLLAFVGGYAVLGHPSATRMKMLSTLYGIGLALTFDEFGLWLHLGGSYWQRASFDAIVVIGALLGLLLVGPRLRSFWPRHWLEAVALVCATVLFAVVMVSSVRYADRIRAREQLLEQSHPVP